MAEAVCGSDTACLYDVMVTENLDFGRATRSAVQEYDETVQLSDPGKLVINLCALGGEMESLRRGTQTVVCCWASSLFNTVN